jgi:hypothetical protein
LQSVPVFASPTHLPFSQVLQLYASIHAKLPLGTFPLRQLAPPETGVGLGIGTTVGFDVGLDVGLDVGTTVGFGVVIGNFIQFP